jgi:hypothetical protein
MMFIFPLQRFHNFSQTYFIDDNGFLKINIYFQGTLIFDKLDF